MKVEAHIVILMKRVHQLEKIIDRLMTITYSHRNQLRKNKGQKYTLEAADNAAGEIFNTGVPFDPSCSNCKAELRVINQGTDWESFECPNCEAWYFPNVH